jgi:hypothetical protein
LKTQPGHKTGKVRTRARLGGELWAGGGLYGFSTL